MSRYEYALMIFNQQPSLQSLLNLLLGQELLRLGRK